MIQNEYQETDPRFFTWIPTSKTLDFVRAL